jgi:hypothetical protein
MYFGHAAALVGHWCLFMRFTENSDGMPAAFELLERA